MLEELEMRDSIAVLEGLAKHDTKGLQRPLPIEYGALFNKALTGGYKVQQAWCDIGIGRFSQIIAQVRSKLLDFLLELSEKVGTEMSDEDVKRVAQSPETGSMFSNAIFGDNVTIMVGNQNQQTVRNEIRKGDFSSLAAFLEGHRVDKQDIAQLQEALVTDQASVDVANKHFGPRVRDWLASMLRKAVETSWQVELGIASNLLTNALQAYYRW